MNRLTQLVASLSLVLAAQVASAGVIDIVSGPGPQAGQSCAYLAGLTSPPASSCALVDINPHPAWATEPALPYGGTWVSYAATGNGGTVVPNSTSPILGVYEQFTIATAGSLDFWIWADDTADLYLDGQLIKAANTSQGTCAVGSIGCEPKEFYRLTTSLVAGSHTIEMRLYQIGGGPFGVLYSARVTDVPEPATLGLLGLGLAGIGFARRRK